ncbi:hypothetical protein FACS189434_00920 [Bacteroidia bacterium]|nr:hypothetical protein FACS189434_00920 [Bacteroidia bacterium]
MRKVILSPRAEQVLDEYFENYQYYFPFGTDMPERAFNYSTIIRYLYQLEVFSDNAYSVDGKNFFVVDGVCLVEYSMLNDGSIVLVKDIHFK